MPVKVKNLNGTAGKTPVHSSSWLEYWEREAGEKAGRCGACSNKAVLGGHVKKADGTDDSHYIAPLCDSCNKLDGVFTVEHKLISAVSK